MKMNPMQKDDNHSNQNSKPRIYVYTILPLSVKLLNDLVKLKKDLTGIGRIQLIGRVIELKVMVGRTQVKMTDSTGVASIVEGAVGDNLEEQEYYKFIVQARLDKEEPVLYCLHYEKLKSFNQLQYHWSNVMMAVQTHKFLQS
jgi:hypothetical protein